MSLVFVTFEGIDGCGKTTLAEAVFGVLGDRAYLTHEPRYLKPSLRDPLALAFLFIADRAEHAIEIRDAQERYDYVLCDRYSDSTYAYQGVLIAESHGMSLNEAVELLKRAHALIDLPVPDMTFLIDLDPEEARSRKDEGFDPELVRMVREAYLSLAQSERRIVVLDGRKSTEDLCREALSAIELFSSRL